MEAVYQQVEEYFQSHYCLTAEFCYSVVHEAYTANKITKDEVHNLEELYSIDYFHSTEGSVISTCD